MFSWIRQKKKVKKALHNSTLQKALERTSSHHFKNFNSTKEEIPWDLYKQKAKAIKDECLNHLPQLIQKFTKEAENAGAKVYFAPTAKEALKIVENIAMSKKARLIIKSKSMVSEEIELNHFLEQKGFKVVETDLGEWIIQLAKERPSHITAPALHKTKEEIAELLSRHFHCYVPPDAKEIVNFAREELREYFLKADIGISGTNLAIAESGTIVIVSNEGNARLVTSCPPVHIALVTTEKFVETMEQASTLIKALVMASSGHKLTAYVSFITGPSRTTDIEKELIVGAHGPKEVHIIILDNGRLALSKDENFSKTLACLKCGGCMFVCPVFQSLGGHVYGGRVYSGGIGILLTAVTRSFKEAASLVDFCADCKKCEEFCPVGIPTGELILQLKHIKGPKLWERIASSFIPKKGLTESGTKILSFIQKPFLEGGYFKKIPVPLAKGKSIPALKIKKSPFPEIKNGKKIYLFHGCLVKYFFPEIQDSVFRTLSHYGFHVLSPTDQVCCGAPSLHMGLQKDARKLAFKNMSSFSKENPDYILTVCPTGNSMLKKFYPMLNPNFSPLTKNIYDFTEFMAKNGFFPSISSTSKKEDLFYHYSCHYLNELKLKEEPRKILTGLGFNLKEEKEPYTCCGFCGVFSIKNPEVSAAIWGKKKHKILESSASIIATDCPACLFQLRSYLTKEKKSFRIFHTSEILAQSLE
ncbi:MAG: LUD domain-containing protein [Candidatus Aminicenantes bacterium]|nr:LUD domain-containing protein [Candidatus Aminicenantes bacterium]